LLVVSSSILSNVTQQTSHYLTTTTYDRCAAQLRTGEDGGGCEMVVSAAVHTCRLVDYLQRSYK